MLISDGTKCRWRTSPSCRSRHPPNRKSESEMPLPLRHRILTKRRPFHAQNHHRGHLLPHHKALWKRRMRASRPRTLMHGRRCHRILHLAFRLSRLYLWLCRHNIWRVTGWECSIVDKPKNAGRRKAEQRMKGSRSPLLERHSPHRSQPTSPFQPILLKHGNSLMELERYDDNAS